MFCEIPFLRANGQTNVVSVRLLSRKLCLSEHMFSCLSVCLIVKIAIPQKSYGMFPGVENSYPTHFNNQDVSSHTHTVHVYCIKLKYHGHSHTFTNRWNQLLHGNNCNTENPRGFDP